MPGRKFVRRFFAAAASIFIFVSLAVCRSEESPKDYSFNGSISREVLENFLSRAVSHQTLGTDDDPELLSDDIRMFVSIGAKFIGRSSIIWKTPDDLTAFFSRSSEIAAQVHRADDEIVLQAGLFETVDQGVNDTEIPGWVFEEFGLVPESRCYRYADMLYEDGSLVDYFAPGNSIPDISRPETRMWFWHRAKLYIDAGYEAIHFGVVNAMAMNDPDHAFYDELLTRVRGYAQANARRHLVLCDAHHPTGWTRNGRTLFDFLSYPLRVQETAGRPIEGTIEAGSADCIYGQTAGGFVPGGWEAVRLPYLVEFDNWGSSGYGGQDIGGIWIWGWDEIDWFSRLEESARNDWLGYAWARVKEMDPYGRLQMPTRRILADPIGDTRYWYYANDSGPSCFFGFNQEGAIKEIWETDG